jgi:hypothetical protein
MSTPQALETLATAVWTDLKNMKLSAWIRLVFARIPLLLSLIFVVLTIIDPSISNRFCLGGFVLVTICGYCLYQQAAGIER